MKVSKIAKKAVVIDKDERLSQAIDLLIKHNISRLPVIDKKELLGVVTERDILLRIGNFRDNLKVSRFHVSSCMTHNPITLSPDQDLEMAIKIFSKHKISGIPVLDDEIKIVTKTDVLKVLKVEGIVRDCFNQKYFRLSRDDRVIHAKNILLNHDLPLVIVDDLEGVVTERDVLFAIYKFRKLIDKHMGSVIRNFPVYEIMSKNVLTSTPQDFLEDVKNKMLENHFSALPVVDDGKILGFISKDELIEKLRK